MYVQGEHEKRTARLEKNKNKKPPTKLYPPSEVDIVSLKTEHLNSCYTCMSQKI